MMPFVFAERPLNTCNMYILRSQSVRTQTHAKYNALHTHAKYNVYSSFLKYDPKHTLNMLNTMYIVRS